MGNVIALRTNNWRSGLAIAPRAAIRIHSVEVEASAEPSPGDTGCVEQVADVLSSHLHLFATGAHIAEWIRVTDDCKPTIAIGYQRTRAPCMFRDAIGLAGNQIDRTHRGRTEVGAVRVIAHRVVLGIVPQRSDRVAIEVSHYLTSREYNIRRSTGWRTRASRVGGKQIHRATVEGQLFGSVIVAHVLRVGLRAIEAKRIGCSAAVERIQIWIVVQKRVAQAVYGRGVDSA